MVESADQIFEVNPILDQLEARQRSATLLWQEARAVLAEDKVRSPQNVRREMITRYEMLRSGEAWIDAIIRQPS
jgi:hypothetical protein